MESSASFITFLLFVPFRGYLYGSTQTLHVRQDPHLPPAQQHSPQPSRTLLSSTATGSFASQNHKLRALTQTAPCDSSAAHDLDQPGNRQQPPACNSRRRSHPRVESFP